MADILLEIVEATQSRLAARKREVPVAALRSLPHCGQVRRGFGAALRTTGLDIIAEHKRRSPSKGVIREDLTLADIVERYERGGASAVSVLTEPSYFGGSLTDLTTARDLVSVPLLRKDFIVDPYQIVESRAFGADAILLIAAVLDKASLAELHAAAKEEGLDVLVEVHSVAELDIVDLDTVDLIGVNNRDLRTFEVDIRTSGHVFPHLPDGAVRVSESGYHAASDVRMAVSMGADAVLVGERLMRDRDAASCIRSWLRAAAEPVNKNAVG